MLHLASLVTLAILKLMYTHKGTISCSSCSTSDTNIPTKFQPTYPYNSFCKLMA